MANIKDKTTQIRQAIYGKDIRESIASGIESINTEVESTTERQGQVETRQTNLENTFAAEIENAISENPASAETVAARTDNINNKTYQNLPERLDDFASSLAEKQTQLEEKSILLSQFPIQVPEVGDTGRLQRLANYCANNDYVKIDFGKRQELTVSSAITFTSSVIIDLKYSTIKCNSEGLDSWFKFTNIDKFEVKNGIFDDNLKGRTIIDVTNCTSFKIGKNIFMGYTAEHGHYATDSAIRIKNSQKFKIDGNIFNTFGNQYGASTETLNRCITINDEFCDYYNIKNNILTSVNQAIVLNGGYYATIRDNSFYDVKDNCIYSLGNVKKLIITNNHFYNGNDEAIIVSAGNITINGNHFYETPNKFIGINGNIDTLNINDNTFLNENTRISNVIAYRDISYTVDVLNFKNNIVKLLKNDEGLSSYTFHFGNCNSLDMTGNYIKVSTIAFHRIIYIEGNVSGNVSNNKIVGSTSDTKSIEILNSTSSLILFENNELVGCRAVNSSMLITRNQKLQGGNSSYCDGNSSVRFIYSSAVPNTATWNRGDIVINTLPTELGTTGSKYIIDRWRCITSGSPGVWTSCRMLTGN